MGWRPSSWWARSQDREPVTDAPRETVSAPVAEPGRSAAGGWRDLPALTPVTATPVQRVADGEAFAAGLAAHADPRFLQRLSHVVDPSVGGLVDGLAVPGEPHGRDAGPDLAVPARPTRPVPRVQRRLAEWQGAEELPTVRWELPDLDDHQPEVDVPSRAAESPAVPHADAVPDPAVPSPQPIGPLLSRPAVQRVVTVEPPRAPRAETPMIRQRQLSAVAAPVSPVPDTPSAPVDPVADSVVDDQPVLLPPVADSPSPQPESHHHNHAHDLDHDHDAAAVTGWTEVALPMAPAEQSLAGSLPVQRSALPAAPGPGPGRVETQPEPRPEARPVTRAEPELPAVQRQPSVPTAAVREAPRTTERPVEQPTPAPTPEASSAPAEESRPVAAPLAVGVPLVQRLASDRPVGGSAMSFTSMFARPSPIGDINGPDHDDPDQNDPDQNGPGQNSPDHDVVSLPTPEATPAPAPTPAPMVVARSVIVGAPSLTSVTRVGQPSSGPHPTPNPTSYTPATAWADHAPVAPVVESRRIAPPAPPTTTQSGFAVAALQRQSQPGQPQPGQFQPGQTLPGQSLPAGHASPGQVLHRLSLQRDPSDEPASTDPQPSPTEAPSPAEAPSASVADSGSSAAAAAAPGPGAAPAAGGAAAPADIDEMARRLYEPLVARIRAELWLDRERSGVFGHG